MKMKIGILMAALACAAVLIQTKGTSPALADEKPVMIERFIYKDLPTHPSCHGSTVVALPNGDVLAAWYAGAGEKEKDVAIFYSRLKKGADEWTKPEILHDNPGHSEGNPVLFAAPDGTVWLFYVTIYGDSWNDCKIHAKVSNDNGFTWSEERTLREKWGWMTRNKPIVLNDGRWLLPLYDETLFLSHFYISDDNGATWKDWGRIMPYLNLQPTVIEREDGSLFAMMRNGAQKNKHIWEALSKSMGEKWTQARYSKIPNPGAAVDMVQLANSHVALAFNPSFTERNPLAVALSEDEGRTWPYMRVIEGGPGGSFHYPAIHAADDGMMHVTYTWKRERIKHVEFNEAWIKENSDPNWLDKIPPE